jgi:hypothetical protein
MEHSPRGKLVRGQGRPGEDQSERNYCASNVESARDHQETGKKPVLLAETVNG